MREASKNDPSTATQHAMQTVFRYFSKRMTREYLRCEKDESSVAVFIRSRHSAGIALDDLWK